jgi:tRNA (guanine26-N2/guanine27-N2)-dimethyltransferase
MYAGPLHSPSFIRRVLSYLPELSKDTYGTMDRIEGMLTLALEESLSENASNDASELEEQRNATIKTEPAEIDLHPFFFIPHQISKVIHCQTPSEAALRGALLNLGYRVTRSHTKAGSIRTNAPWTVIWDIMRAWVKQKSPIREGAIKEGTAGWSILQKPATINVVFDEELGRPKDNKKLIRYQVNPRANWGPMARAKGVQDHEQP